jgi:protein-glutamine gamma-glutamyltransferase
MQAIPNPLRRFPPIDRFWRWLEYQPAPETEESIPLRILVQILVFIGIAASDVASGSNNSAWGIPLSAIGGVWGWYARRRKNVMVKFAIALAMIAMLIVFLNKVVAQQDDTKILLSSLLIQLQVLHSFDLPRRKDLGYSTLIGLILLGVAGTLSQTTVFGIWLLAFVAIALPVLVLDYRSRLGLSKKSLTISQAGGIPLRSLLGFLVLVLVVGLTIFALLPRLPGFQLRNFPVSANLSVQRQVPAGGIITRNQANTSANQTNGVTAGDENGDPNVTNGLGVPLLPPLFAPEIDQASSRFLNLQLKPELVMRVRSQAELFWRVMAYDRYTGKGWKISRNGKDQIRTIKRSPFNYEFFIPLLSDSAIDTKSTKEVIQTYTITTEAFPNLVPAAYTPNRLYFPSEEIDRDVEGNIRSPGPLPLDLTYTVISEVPLRDRTALSRASQTYPKFILNNYLDLPESVSTDVKTKALQIITDARNVVGDKPLNLNNSYDRALYLTQTLKQKFQIKNIPFDPSKGDIASQFITNQGGNADHFATTLTVMLRSLGIPARYTVGFAPGKFNAFTGLYEVMNTDTRSVVEVYFPRYGWIAFDPLPGQDLFPPTVESDGTFSVLRQFWNWVAGFLPSPIAGFFTVVFSTIGKFLTSGIGGLINWLGGLGWVGIFVGVVILFGAGFVGWGIWQILSFWGDRLKLQRLHPTERAYRQMLQLLSEQGMTKPSYQTPQEYADLIRLKSLPQADVVDEITQAYQDWYYGDRPISKDILANILRKLKGLKFRS